MATQDGYPASKSRPYDRHKKNTTRVSNRPRDIISLNDALRTRRRAPARVNLEGNLSCLVEAFSDAAVLDGGAL